MLREQSIKNVLKKKKNKVKVGTSLAVQQLRLCISTARGTGLIPGLGTKIPQAPRCSQKNKQANKVKVREGRSYLLQTSWCRNPLFLQLSAWVRI